MYGIGYLQRLGRAMMLPMTVLPAAAIFLMLARLPWDSFGWEQVPEMLHAAGMAIFEYVPYVFAIGIALGMSNQSATAGMGALVGMFIFHVVAHTYDPNGVQPSMFAGVVIGILSAWAHDRFKSFRLPEYLQFLGGSRFVPLFMSAVSLAFAWLMIGLGEGLQSWAASAGTLVYSAGGFGVFLYGFLHRILVAFGLHHILNHLFWFQVGEYQGADGAVYFGDLPRFFAGDTSAGIFMAGLYPTMMFALPAVAFAIIHEAREDLKPKTSKQFRAAALGSFLTGITEPVEFAFLFVAPYLFLIHAVLSGGVMWLVYELDIHHGFAFSAGVLEYLVNLPLAQRGWLLLPIGAATGLLYYVLFRWSIRRFQLATPGREDSTRLDDWAGDIPYRAPLILQALGGKENMVRLEACITRLRLTLEDDRKVDVQSLRHLGAAGVIRLGGGHVQVVFGTFSELIREEIHKIMQTDVQQIQFHSPVQGRMIPLEEVDDPIFSGRLVGRGVAFVPDKGELVAPVQGKIIHIHPSLHAIGLVTKDGLEVLLHVGINTSQLEGKGFTALVQIGDEVSPGQPLLKFHIPTLKQHAKSLETPMVITNSDKVKSWRFAPYKAVKKGQAAVMSVVVHERENKGAEK
ncbi:PTS glucose transporter subunit IIA [Cohnella sp. CIP 111063]|uniref:glucose PTS transporter subunit IIA n=1 Tax=unclassified Cohnella TaxID=2636738 RepID=UPI000B8BE4A5|nr:MULTISPECIES: glucose PTS transporter subunit IIA [unclassified Cohnella]OXS62367.1 PTS glucose transporter subunit IIA [Cohnella sp. CIP 111063]PRX74598.1 PTS system D-glucosamine-specific IIC component [Cohnella sp. SGD-V74]